MIAEISNPYGYMAADAHIMRIQKIGKVIAVICFALVPSGVSAQVVINEVMYNPDGSDTGREWIELYNAGAADVTMVAGSGNGSWRVSDSSNHTLVDPAGGVGRGSLTIPAGGYLIIASDPAQFISGGYAGGSYSVIKSSISLNNNNATTSLIDGTGTLLNSFMYTNDMGGNGDGTSLQKNGGTWIAALPTPGATNATTAYIPPSSDTNSNTDTSTTTTTSSSAGAPVSSYVAPPEPQIFADGGENRTVIVAADTEFLGRAYNRKKETISGHIRFLWNFGDGRTAEGQSVMHHFEYPGRYVVVLNIAENTEAASDRLIVTAEPARLAFAALPDGSVVIQNNAGRDLDLSGWIVRSFGRSFVVPKDSIILAGESLRIGDKTLGFRSSPDPELDYPNGAPALQAGAASTESKPEESKPAPPVSSSPPAVQNAPAVSPSFDNAESQADAGDVPKSEPADAAGDGVETSASSSQIAAAGATAPDSGGAYLWWFGAVGLAIVGGGAVVALRRARKREWDIVEESAD